MNTSVIRRLVAQSSLLEPKPIKLSKPIRVTIAGAAGRIGYILSFMIAQGRMFGKNQRVILTLLDLPRNLERLCGLAMELEDSTLVLLTDVNYTSNLKKAFKKCEYAILASSVPRKQRSFLEMLKFNAPIFKTLGEALSQFAETFTKVIIVSNPVMTNALICEKFAQLIPPENITAVTRLDYNRAMRIIKKKLNLNFIGAIKNLTIWGNHSQKQVPDIDHSLLKHYPHKDDFINLKTVIDDPEWIKKKFIDELQQRSETIFIIKKKSPALSSADAICDHVHDMYFGTWPGEWISMGVTSANNPYKEIPEDLFFSFPVVIEEGKWRVVPRLKFSPQIKGLLNETIDELLMQRKLAYKTLNMI